MKRICAVLMLVLTGCVEPPPPQPSPAMQKLQAACDGGDTESCATVAEIEQRERERRAAVPPPVFTPAYNDPPLFQNNRAPAPAPTPLQSGMKVCPNGMIVQQYYIC